MAFIVLASYTGGFGSKLTSSRIHLPAKTLQDVVKAAENGKIKICLDPNAVFAAVEAHCTYLADDCLCYCLFHIIKCDTFIICCFRLMILALIQG